MCKQAKKEDSLPGENSTPWKLETHSRVLIFGPRAHNIGHNAESTRKDGASTLAARRRVGLNCPHLVEVARGKVEALALAGLIRPAARGRAAVAVAVGAARRGRRAGVREAALLLQHLRLRSPKRAWRAARGCQRHAPPPGVRALRMSLFVDTPAASLARGTQGASRGQGACNA